MTTALTNLFEFLARNPRLHARRETFVSSAFSEVRYSLRRVVEELQDVEDELARQLSVELQVCLLEWLTTPKAFGMEVLQSLLALGARSHLDARWGSEMGQRIENARSALKALGAMKNPLRQGVADAIGALRAEGREFRIYCHRTAAEHYQSALADAGMDPLSESQLFHSLVDYRESDLFDVLVKVGPLKVRGWGSAPDALVTAPKFAELRTFVWEGSSDDPHFGYDPAATPRDEGGDGSGVEGVHGGRITWNTVQHGGHERTVQRESRDIVDEINLFREMGRRDGLRKAILIALTDGHGVLLTPNSQVTALTVRQGEGSIKRGPARELLMRGSFLVRAQVGSIDLGTTRAELGSFSQRWKEHLARLAKEDRAGLIEKLRNGGLELFRLSSAIDHWLRSPTTVIHAPQQIRHFKILIEVLGLTAEVPFGSIRRSWWELAWDEVSRSRGVAIRDGVVEQDVREEQCVSALEANMLEIAAHALAEGSFRISFPPGSAVSGFAIFDRVESIEDGFMVPEGDLTVLRELKEADQWRA